MTTKLFDVTKIKSIAQTCTAQEMFAALVWQRQFNNFDGKQVVSDLVNHCDLWSSFLFTRQIFPTDNEGFSFSGLSNILISMANNRQQNKIKIVRRSVYSVCVAYNADTLYVLTKNRDAIITRLIDFGKKWNTDSVEVFDGRSNQKLSVPASISLSRSLITTQKNEREDGAVVSYWWD